MRNMLLDETNVKQLARDAYNMGLDAAAEIIASTPKTFVDREALAGLSAEHQAIVTGTIDEVCAMLSKVILDAQQPPRPITKGS